MDRFFLITVLFLIGLSQGADAATAQDKPIKIAVLDYSRVMQEAKAASQMRQDIDRYRAQFQSEILKIEDQLRELEQNLSKDDKQKESKEVDEKRAAVELKVSEVQEKTLERRTQLGKVLDEAQNTILEKIKEITVKLAEKEKYTLILPKSMVIFNEPSYEISELVIQLLNKELPKVNIVIPEISK